MTPTTTTRIASATAYAVLPAEDLARARAFYHDTLGFGVEDMPDADAFLIHAGGDSRVLVYHRARTVAQHTVAGFAVEDLESTVSDLKEHGVRLEEYDLPGLKTVDGIATMPSGEKSAWFTDTEGNILAINQMLH